MSFVYGIRDREKDQILSIRAHLEDILDEWNDLSCDHVRHKLIMIKPDKQRKEAFSSWSRRLNISRTISNLLLLELESLARKPVNGVQVRKINWEKE